jgi:hypothetical protein
MAKSKLSDHLLSIERIVDSKNPIYVELLRKEIQKKIDEGHNELAHLEFYLVQSAHTKNCTVCAKKLDQVKAKRRSKK